MSILFRKPEENLMTVSVQELAESNRRQHNAPSLPTATPKERKRDYGFTHQVTSVILANDKGDGLDLDAILRLMPPGTPRINVSWAANSAIKRGILRRVKTGVYARSNRVLHTKPKRRKAKRNGAAAVVVQAVAGQRVGIPSIDKDLKRLDAALAALVTIEQTITKYRGLVQQIAALEKILGK